MAGHSAKNSFRRSESSTNIAASAMRALPQDRSRPPPGHRAPRRRGALVAHPTSWLRRDTRTLCEVIHPARPDLFRALRMLIKLSAQTAEECASPGSHRLQPRRGGLHLRGTAPTLIRRSHVRTGAPCGELQRQKRTPVRAWGGTPSTCRVASTVRQRPCPRQSGRLLPPTCTPVSRETSPPLRNDRRGRDRFACVDCGRPLRRAGCQTPGSDSTFARRTAPGSPLGARSHSWFPTNATPPPHVRQAHELPP